MQPSKYSDILRPVLCNHPVSAIIGYSTILSTYYQDIQLSIQCEHSYYPTIHVPNTNYRLSKHYYPLHHYRNMLLCNYSNMQECKYPTIKLSKYAAFTLSIILTIVRSPRHNKQRQVRGSAHV